MGSILGQNLVNVWVSFHFFSGTSPQKKHFNLQASSFMPIMKQPAVALNGTVAHPQNTADKYNYLFHQYD